jgi:hypothetical protein
MEAKQKRVVIHKGHWQSVEADTDIDLLELFEADIEDHERSVDEAREVNTRPPGSRALRYCQALFSRSAVTSAAIAGSTAASSVLVIIAAMYGIAPANVEIEGAAFPTHHIRTNVPHPAKGDIRALEMGAGFEPEQA